MITLIGDIGQVLGLFVLAWYGAKLVGVFMD